MYRGTVHSIDVLGLTDVVVVVDLTFERVTSLSILTQQFMSETEAWSAHDVDRIVEESGGAGAGLGFGYRFRDARVGGTVQEQRQALTAWFETVDRFMIDDVDVNCSVDNDVATVWGFFTENFAHKGQDPERVRVRFSKVLRRVDDRWQPVWNHRDIQEFAGDGFYIRKPIQDA